MKSLSTKILKNLTPLIGLRLSAARRAATMRVFHFGEILEVDDGSVGEFALRIQCSWRLEYLQKIVTGSSDLWRPSKRKKGFDWDTWDYHKDGNVQDERLLKTLAGYDLKTESSINQTENLIVEKIEADDIGGAIISLSGDFKLVLFPNGTSREHWRFFRPRVDKRHFVVEN